MSGFMSTSTAMIVCNADGKKFDLEKLRAHAFSNTVNPDGQRIGWVGLGDLLDTENFFLATVSGQYAGFSLRIDSKKPSGAVIKLKLAEAIRDEMAQFGKCTGKRKKELKEAVTANVTAKTEFVPTVIDCLWDLAKNRLCVAVSSMKALEPMLAQIHATFGVQPEPILPQNEICNAFAAIIKDGNYTISGYSLSAVGTASLVTSEQAEEKASVAVQNNLNAANNALADGLAIKKMQMLFSPTDNPHMELAFTLDENLIVTGLKFPKPEKDAEEDATLLVNADICGMVGDIVEGLAEV